MPGLIRPKTVGPTVGTVVKLPRGSGARVLAHVPLFSGLSPRDLHKISSLAEETWFGPGHVVSEEGKQGSAFYVILDGEARVTKGTSGRTLRRLGPGDYFGEMALLDGGPRSATVIAESTLDIVRIPRPAFRRMVLQEPAVGLRIMARLAGRVRELEKQLG